MNTIRRTGPLNTLLAEPDVTDVVVNGGRVWVDRGSGMERVDLDLGDDVTIRRLAQRFAALCGRRLDDAQPWVDVRLPDGTRFHAILPPLSVEGVSLSLRTFRRRVFRLNELIEIGTLTKTSARIVTSLVKTRLSYLVTGGTGSGKTTLLGSLLSCVPSNERMVIVEDVTELRCAHPHVVSLQARVANSEGAGEVTLRQLVRQALRMRPDRLVVGECRGAEVIELLAALNTGHDGSAGTIHANSPQDVPARIQALAASGGMSPMAVTAHLAAGLHCVLHVQRHATGRALSEIGVLCAEDGHIWVEPAWVRGAERDSTAGAARLKRLFRDRGEDVEW